MFSILREKAVLTVVMLLIAGMVIGVAHNYALDSGKSFPAQDAIRFVMRPGSTVFHGLFSIVGQIGRFVRPRSSIRSENARLRKEVLRLTQENASMREAVEENIRLRQALKLRQSLRMNMIAAEVISRKESSWFDTATIDKGRHSGVVKGSAIITPRGLVGQVLEANLFTSQIVSLSNSDSSIGIGAMVQRSRASGILQGQGNDYLALSYLPKDADVKKNDIVISSGMGQVIPKGLVIGRVVKVIHNPVAGTTSALVSPSVPFDTIEQVFIIKPGQSLPE